MVLDLKKGMLLFFALTDCLFAQTPLSPNTSPPAASQTINNLQVAPPVAKPQSDSNLWFYMKMWEALKTCQPTAFMVPMPVKPGQPPVSFTFTVVGKVVDDNCQFTLQSNAANAPKLECTISQEAFATLAEMAQSATTGEVKITKDSPIAKMMMQSCKIVP